MKGYTICGLFYNENPKSRIEKILLDIYNKGGGGGEDDPESDLDIGRGLKVTNGVLSVNSTSVIETGNNLPAQSNGVHQQIEKADMILQMI